MARILAIDGGAKRVGLAVTDPEQLIARGLTTVAATEMLDYLKKYLSEEPVERFVVGDPRNLDNTPAESAPVVQRLVQQLRKTFPDIPV